MRRASRCRWRRCAGPSRAGARYRVACRCSAFSPPSSFFPCVECSLAHLHSISHIKNFTVIFTHEWDLPEVRGSPQGYAVSVGHFTHFAFTVNFTHYVKTKPDSGFTVKSRTLLVELALGQSGSQSLQSTAGRFSFGLTFWSLPIFIFYANYHHCSLGAASGSGLGAAMPTASFSASYRLTSSSHLHGRYMHGHGAWCMVHAW